MKPPIPETAPLPKNKRPFPVTPIAWFYFIRAGVFFLLLLVMLGASVSHSVSHKLWLHVSVFNLLPRLFSPLLVAVYGVEDSYREVLPAAFLSVALFSALAGRLLWMLNRWMRWIVMLACAATVVGTLLALAAGQTAGNRMALLVNAVVNLLIFSSLAFYPGVAQAFEKV
jgi:hypothetical protein